MSLSLNFHFPMGHLKSPIFQWETRVISYKGGEQASRKGHQETGFSHTRDDVQGLLPEALKNTGFISPRMVYTFISE
jgi:hypothetical protein